MAVASCMPSVVSNAGMAEVEAGAGPHANNAGGVDGCPVNIYIHETFARIWVNVGPTSSTLAQQ